jgi:hypothetical protein
MGSTRPHLACVCVCVCVHMTSCVFIPTFSLCVCVRARAVPLFLPIALKKRRDNLVDSIAFFLLKFVLVIEGALQEHVVRLVGVR